MCEFLEYLQQRVLPPARTVGFPAWTWGPPQRRHKGARRQSRTHANCETGRLTPCWSSILEKENGESEGDCLLWKQGLRSHCGCLHLEFISYYPRKNEPIWALATVTTNSTTSGNKTTNSSAEKKGAWNQKGQGLRRSCACVFLYYWIPKARVN